MLKLLITTSLLTVTAASAYAQEVIQGDSVYRGLQVGRATGAQVVDKLGPRHRTRRIMGRYSAKLRTGECVSETYVARYAWRYRGLGLTCLVDAKTDALKRLIFDSSAQMTTTKGIKPGQHYFADVVARYGIIDFAEEDRVLPRVEEVLADDKQWCTVLVYPSISFVSPGRRKPGEDLKKRLVTQVWLNNN